MFIKIAMIKYPTTHRIKARSHYCYERLLLYTTLYHTVNFALLLTSLVLVLHPKAFECCVLCGLHVLKMSLSVSTNLVSVNFQFWRAFLPPHFQFILPSHAEGE